jgi:hypothetical protein
MNEVSEKGKMQEHIEERGEEWNKETEPPARKLPAYWKKCTG